LFRKQNKINTRKVPEASPLISDQDLVLYISNETQERPTAKGCGAMITALNISAPPAENQLLRRLLNRKPFKGRDTLRQIAPIYCTKNPGHWKASVLHLEHEIVDMATAEAESE
jgi:hypothetical protein